MLKTTPKKIKTLLFGLLIAAVVVVAYVDWADIAEIGSLPGDFVIEEGQLDFYFPLATVILLSLGSMLAWDIYAYRTSSQATSSTEKTP